jgi:hypothetical protein
VLKERAAPLGLCIFDFMLGDFNSASVSAFPSQRKTASSRRSAIFPSGIVEYRKKLAINQACVIRCRGQDFEEKNRRLVDLGALV